MYTALYRAERPEVFDELLGQEHIVKILKHQIEADSVSHAYLFCGTRGTGKTTTARILAKAVNCLDEDRSGRPCGRCANCQAIKNGSFVDVIEIDAASNNGVENIRELRESVNYPPTVGRKKVYVIDEVHMLSQSAFNALLKTLEEPPENVIFILATTEPQKLPQTVLSRCMRLDFKRVSQNEILSGMGRICAEKGVEITDGALKLLANAADGSVRDGLSILDQVLAAGDKKIDRDKVLEYIGTVGEDFFIDLTEFTAVRNVSGALLLLNDALSDGKDVKQLMKDWSAHYRNLLVTKFVKNPEDLLNMSSENVARLIEQSKRISLEEINTAIIRLAKAIDDARWSTQPRVLMEIAIVAIATGMDESKALRPQTAPRTAANYGREQTADAAAASEQAKPEASEKRAAGTVKTEPETPEKREARSLEASPAAAAEPAGTADSLTQAERDEIWLRVFEACEKLLASSNLLRTTTRLERLEANTFSIVVNNSFTKRYAERESGILESTVSEIVGRPLRMNSRIGDVNLSDGAAAGPSGSKDLSAGMADCEETVRKAEELYGIKIDIE